jgi:dUTP pyrophosphatase
MQARRIHPDAKLPERQTPCSAGYDISCVEGQTIAPRSRALFSTGLVLTVPQGTYGQIAPRSGLSTRGIDVGAGVIDRDYTGEVRVLLRNHSDAEVCIKAGDRIAQLIVKKIEFPQVQKALCLPEFTQRGQGGFGSTGA